MTGNVGILAYGSLITDPGDEILAVRTRITENIATPFPVEYARSSAGRGGAPTLVPFERGCPVQSQLFLVDTSVEDAADRLYRREINAVGSRRRYQHKTNPSDKDVIVDRIESFLGVSLTLYTRIAATIVDPTAERLADLAIGSVAKADKGRDGITYLINAISAGIQTPLTEEYAAEIMRRVNANTLEEALATIRSGA